MNKVSAFLILGFAWAALSGPALTAAKQSTGDCSVVLILPDGREIRSTGKAASAVSKGSNSSHASGAAASSSSASSNSSVSVSSSSSGRGRRHARAATSHTDEQGRQVTTVRDETGCKITIDERE